MIQQKKEILGFFKDLEFNEKEHKYSVNGDNLKLSVSGVINNFVKPFNKYLISKRVAESRGCTQKEVLAEWEHEREVACNRGNQVHLFGELYPFNKHLKPRNKWEEAIVKFWADVPEHIFPVIMELQMYHKEYMYGGTSDILLFNSKTQKFIIGDYKTNKDIFKNYKGKKMLPPFSNLLDNPFNKYQLQLSFYQILFEQIGFEVESRKLVWLLPTGEYEMYDLGDHTSTLKFYLKNNML